MAHGTLADLEQNINNLSNQFQKPVLVLETAYPFTLQWNDNTHNVLGLETQLLPGYEASEEGQVLFLNDLVSLVDENIFGLVFVTGPLIGYLQLNLEALGKIKLFSILKENP